MNPLLLSISPEIKLFFSNAKQLIEHYLSLFVVILHLEESNLSNAVRFNIINSLKLSIISKTDMPLGYNICFAG